MNLNPWLTGGVFVYAFFVKLVRLREDCLLQAIDRSLTDASGKEQQVATGVEERLLASVASVRDLKESLVCAFFLVPCLWFAFLYTKVPMVYEIAGPATGALVLGIRTQIVVLQFLILAYLIQVCEWASAGTRDQTRLLTRRLLSKTCGMKNLARELEANATFQFTVWSMFDMNRRFALSFLSSLITFTVLFVQIASSGRQGGASPVF